MKTTLHERLEDAISITPYIRSVAENVRGMVRKRGMRLEDATLDSATETPSGRRKVASSRRNNRL